MEKQGYRILARAYELFSFPYLGLGTHTRKIKEKPDEIRRAIKATIRANRFIRDNRDEAVRTLVDWGKVERDFAYASYDALRNLFNADGGVPEDGLKLVIDQARRSAKITREVAPDEVVDLTFLTRPGGVGNQRRMNQARWAHQRNEPGLPTEGVEGSEMISARLLIFELEGVK